MPYFCQNPKCKRHVWFDQRRDVMSEPAPNDDTWPYDNRKSYNVVQVQSQAVVYGRQKYYLCEDCAAKLKSGSSVEDILGNQVGAGEVLPDPLGKYSPWMPWW